MRARRTTLALLLLATALVAWTGLTPAGATSRAAPRASAGAGPGFGLPALHATRGARPAIVDAQGRQVVLRGVNLNSLGDYYQDDPALPTVIPVRERDWEAMAAQGFNVVRLIVSWSALEPRRGYIDQSYVARIGAAVNAAARHGMYTVIDMHQDAWGKFIASPPGTTCPAGTSPAIGWDGAPQWATLIGDASTCRGSAREDSEAVRTAWDAFWSDRAGIQSELVGVWNRLARTFAQNSAVAGFDLLNEPGVGHDATASLAGVADYYRRAISAIRAGEQAAHGFTHPIFFEYMVDGAPVPADFSDDPGLVFAPHIYGGSIAPVSVDINWAFAVALAAGYQTAIWSGEYGWFSDPAANEPKLERFAQLEDQNLAGSAWWQWRQACGDPHSIGTPGGTPAPVIVEYQLNGCPGDHNLGVVPEWHHVVSRAYPRAAPGLLDSSTSDPNTGVLHIAADSAARGATLDLWVPAGSRATPPSLAGTGVADAHVAPIAGGYRVTATVCTSSYQAAVNATGPQPPERCPA